MLRHTVDNGPGKNAYVAGFRVGGKSGTSQKLDSDNSAARIASFVGVAPADDPKIAVLIVLDEPNTFRSSGGTLAAPVVGQVIRDTLQYLDVAPVYTAEEREKVETTVPDVTGIDRHDASDRLAAAGLNCSTRGQQSTVTGQSPAAGQVLPRGSTVVLYTEDTQPALVTVPSLEGLTPEQAADRLAEAGLNLAALGPANQEGTVAASQSVSAGALLPAGSAVEVSFYDPSVPAD